MIIKFYTLTGETVIMENVCENILIHDIYEVLSQKFSFNKLGIKLFYRNITIDLSDGDKMLKHYTTDLVPDNLLKILVISKLGITKTTEQINNTCPICFKRNPVNYVILKRCNHMICYDCCYNIINKKTYTCCICNKDIENFYHPDIAANNRNIFTHFKKIE